MAKPLQNTIIYFAAVGCATAAATIEAGATGMLITLAVGLSLYVLVRE